jgi:hypothetical protein
LDLELLAGLHFDCEGDAFEAWNEVEGAFFGDGCETLRGVGSDRQGAFSFCDADGFGIGLGEWFGGAGDDGEDELELGLSEGVGARGD